LEAGVVDDVYLFLHFALAWQVVLGEKVEFALLAGVGLTFVDEDGKETGNVLENVLLFIHEVVEVHHQNIELEYARALTCKEIPSLYRVHILLAASKPQMPHIMLPAPLLPFQRLFPLLRFITDDQDWSEEDLGQVTFLEVGHEFVHVLEGRLYACLLGLDLDEFDEGFFGVFCVQTVHALLEGFMFGFVERVDLLVDVQVLLLDLCLLCKCILKDFVIYLL
jgi:hypothetical protein